MLAQPKEEVEYDMYIDASHSGLKAILMQWGKVITYSLRQLKDFNTNTP